MGLHWRHPPWKAKKKTAKHRSAAVEGEGWRLPVEKLPVVPSHPLNENLRPAQRRWQKSAACYTPKGDMQILSFIATTCADDLVRVCLCQ